MSSDTRTRSAGKRVYIFGTTVTEGDAGMRDLLGGKGANLAEMCRLELPVPPGFTITTEVCTAYYRDGSKLLDGLEADVDAALAQVGATVGATCT